MDGWIDVSMDGRINWEEEGMEIFDTIVFAFDPASFLLKTQLGYT